MLSLHAPELLLDFGRRWHLRLGGRACPHLPACGRRGHANLDLSIESVTGQITMGESAQAGELLPESESGRC